MGARYAASGKRRKAGLFYSSAKRLHDKDFYDKRTSCPNASSPEQFIGRTRAMESCIERWNEYLIWGLCLCSGVTIRKQDRQVRYNQMNTLGDTSAERRL